jgi:hypothetical protein
MYHVPPPGRTYYVSAVDRTPITVNFVDNTADIGYSYTVLPSTVTWLFLVLLKR